MSIRSKITLLALGTAISLASSSSFAYAVKDGKIIDDQQNPVQLRGVNWSGFESSLNTISGLSKRNWKDLIDQMQSLGFNAVRLPFCPATLHGVTPTNVDYTLNPELKGLDSVQLMDKIINELSNRGMYILLDHHSPNCHGITSLWYTSTYSEANWLDDLRAAAKRYMNVPGVIGIDLKNEPNGSATWGTGNQSTDWNKAAERGAAAVLAVAPKWLIAVEGIAQSFNCSVSGYAYYWGENFEPMDCTPLNIPKDRLILSPHTYGPDTYPQNYFNASNFPDNMPAIWEKRFGHFVQQGFPVVLGEFGGKYGEGDKRDVPLENKLIDYLISKGINSGFYWTWNADSNDTGGILRSDWKTVRDDKIFLLKTLWGKYSTPPKSSSSTTTGNSSGSSGSTQLPNSATPAQPSTPVSPVSPVTPTQPSSPAQPPVSSPARNPVTVTTISHYDWGFFYCDRFEVQNNGSIAINWQTVVPATGRVVSSWGVWGSQSNARLYANGTSSNRLLNPGAKTLFGFCAVKF